MVAAEFNMCRYRQPDLLLHSTPPISVDIYFFDRSCRPETDEKVPAGHAMHMDWFEAPAAAAAAAAQTLSVSAFR
jgi:hypothetical protein